MKDEVLEYACIFSFVCFIITVFVVGNYFHKKSEKTENVKIEMGSVIQLENGKFEKVDDSFKKW